MQQLHITVFLLKQTTDKLANNILGQLIDSWVKVFVMAIFLVYRLSLIMHKLN